MALTTVLLFDALLVATCLLPTVRESRYLTGYVLAATGVLVVWQSALWCASRYRGTRLAVERIIKKPHYAQLCAQSCVYVYWGLYWTEVREHVPLIVVQILFAYALDMVLTWSRGRVWQLGFGPFPIILSINLFLWFREPYFYLQFLLVALTYLAKHFIQRKHDGRPTHIFNPSGFSLAVTSVVLLATDSIYTTWGLDFIVSFQLPPNIFEVILVAGLFVQFFFRVVLVSFGAALSMFLWFCFFAFALDKPLGPTAIDPAVFLGLTLLVTDPVTSPKTPSGKFVYGILYGLGVSVTYVLLRLGGEPTYFDKLLVVPVVNALAPAIDKLAARLNMGKLTLGHGTHTLLYICFFFAIVWFLKTPIRNAPGGGFQSALPPVVVQPGADVSGLVASPQMQGLLAKHGALCDKYPKCCEPFGFLHEPQYWRDWRSPAPVHSGRRQRR